MNLPAGGSCQCGQVRLTLAAEPLFTYACHCRDCQKRTGSAFSMGLVVMADTVSIKGDLTTWARTSDDGQTNTRYSCASCGNIIYGDSTASPGIWKLQAGLLEDTSGICPGVHIWTCRKQGWVELPPGAAAFDTQPDNLADLLPATASD
jgi:hypothetical protein